MHSLIYNRILCHIFRCYLKTSLQVYFASGKPGNTSLSPTVSNKKKSMVEKSIVICGMRSVRNAYMHEFEKSFEYSWLMSIARYSSWLETQREITITDIPVCEALWLILRAQSHGLSTFATAVQLILASIERYVEYFRVWPIDRDGNILSKKRRTRFEASLSAFVCARVCIYVCFSLSQTL